VDVDEPPRTVRLVHRIFVFLAEEVKLRHALLEIFDGLRVVAGLVEVEANRARILLAAPDGFVFPLAAAFNANIFDDRGGGDKQDHDETHGHEHRVAALAVAAATNFARSSERIGCETFHHCELGSLPAPAPEPPPPVAGGTIATRAWRPVEISS